MSDTIQISLVLISTQSDFYSCFDIMNVIRHVHCIVYKTNHDIQNYQKVQFKELSVKN